MEKRKTGLAFELLTTVIAHSDISNSAMCTLAANLWGLVQRTGHADTKAMVCSVLNLVCLLVLGGTISVSYTHLRAHET